MKINWSKWEGLLWVGGILLVLSIGLSASWLFWEDLRAKEESLSSTVRNIGLIIGGIIAVMLTIWRSRVAESQAANDRHSLLNERYQKGAEMLGSPVLSVRMGGIYALQRLGEEQPSQYHTQILALLCAFVRHPTRDEAESSLTSTEAIEVEAEESPREDVQAILEIIRQRDQSLIELEEQSSFVLDLRGASLRNARLWGAKLNNANLDGANLSGAQVTEADFSGASLRDVNFFQSEALKTDLSNSIMDRANLKEAMLMGADFSGTQLLEASLQGAILVKANLSCARMSRANLSRSQVMGTDMSGAALLSAELSGTFLSNPTQEDKVTGFRFNSDEPIRGITQDQLDSACANPFNPPKVEGVTDSGTGEQLIWRGRSPSD